MTRNTIFFILGLIVLASGVWLIPQIAPKADRSPDVSQLDMAQLPRLTVEGTVTALYLDDTTACENTCPAQEYPLDKATVTITAITDISNPSQLDTSEVQVGREVPVLFGYSARKAVVTYRMTTPEPVSSDPNGTVSHTVDSSPAQIENGVVTYTFESDTAQPTLTLPGVSVGDTIRATLDYGFAGNHIISKYEVIH